MEIALFVSFQNCYFYRYFDRGSRYPDTWLTVIETHILA